MLYLGFRQLGTCIRNTRHLENMTDVPNHFYVTLFSNSSQKLFPDNTINAFTSELAQVIDLGPDDRREVGLCEFSCPPKSIGTLKPNTVVGGTNVIFYCNVIKPQFFVDNLIRCLRKVIVPSLHCDCAIDHIYYLPVEQTRIKHIRMELKDLLGNPVNTALTRPSGNVPIKVVLHSRCVPT